MNAGPATRAGTAREVVLDRILAALARGTDPAGQPVPVARDYLMAGPHPPGSPELIELLTDRLLDYRARVTRCAPGDVAATITAVLARHTGPGAGMIVDAGFPAGWREGWSPTQDEGLSAVELDHAAGVVTTCALAIAQTGTLVLDGSPGHGRRAISLVPDLHVCLVAAGDVVGTVPEAMARLTPRRPMTWISGPSATSDIELSRVEGVHGPRRLEVVIIEA